MADEVVLHIGTHKTGSSSLQQFLRDSDDTLLAQHGFHYPPGLVLPASHSELPLLALRPDRMWPARIRFPETTSPAWLAVAEAHVREVVRACPHRGLVLSHEDLSYARHADELDRLRDLLGEVSVRVVVYVREPIAFLRSYTEQLQATGFGLSDDPGSYAYVRPDSWLVDRDELVAVFAGAFGRDRVEVLDYDAVVAADGSVIPAFAQVLGIAREQLPPLDRYFLNRTGAQLRPSPEQLEAIHRRLAAQIR